MLHIRNKPRKKKLSDAEKHAEEKWDPVVVRKNVLKDYKFRWMTEYRKCHTYFKLLVSYVEWKLWHAHVISDWWQSGCSQQKSEKKVHYYLHKLSGFDGGKTSVWGKKNVLAYIYRSVNTLNWDWKHVKATEFTAMVIWKSQMQGLKRMNARRGESNNKKIYVKSCMHLQIVFRRKRIKNWTIFWKKIIRRAIFLSICKRSSLKNKPHSRNVRIVCEIFYDANSKKNACRKPCKIVYFF